MTVYAGTIAGPYHVDRGQENQDAHWFLSEKGFTVMLLMVPGACQGLVLGQRLLCQLL